MIWDDKISLFNIYLKDLFIVIKYSQFVVFN